MLSHFTVGVQLLPLFAPAVKTSVARNPMIALVAGGGFELQSRIHSGQVIDSATREKGTIGINSDSFLHFSYTFSRQPRAALAFVRPTHETTLPHHRKCDALRSVRGQRMPFRSAELPAEIGDEVHQQSESTWRWQPVCRFELLKLLGAENRSMRNGSA